MLQRYHEDTNHDQGWTVHTEWRPISDWIEAPTIQTYSTLGEARHAGLQFSCLNGVTIIRIYPDAQTDHLVCSYDRESNLWRDHDARIVVYERACDHIDMTSHLMRLPISETEQHTFLQAVEIGGNTARNQTHPVAQWCKEQQLLTWSEHRWYLTADALRLLEHAP